jgi:hypothetical protein
MKPEAVCLKGVQFVTDGAGRRTAVLISLSEWDEVWQDMQDIMVSEARKHEPTVPWGTLKAEIPKRKRHARVRC